MYEPGELMSGAYHAVVWIDHHQARVFRFDAGDAETTLVHSSDPHSHIHHKANAGDSGHAPLDKSFLRRVAASLADAGAILITGPAGAKQELLTYLSEQQPGVAARVAGLEPLDHPTDGELVAFARKFFHAADRMQAQFRQGMHQ